MGSDESWLRDQQGLGNLAGSLGEGRKKKNKGVFFRQGEKKGISIIFFFLFLIFFFSFPSLYSLP
jgi:hypothetical protein